MTQRETVLRMLKDAGTDGVRSDAFYQAFIPRFAARVWELRQEGHEISSEHEKQFVRYRLESAEVDVGALPQQAGSRTRASVDQSVDSPTIVSASHAPVVGESARLFEMPEAA